MTPASTDDSHAKESYFIYGPPSPPPPQHQRQQQVLEHDGASPQSPAKRAKWAAAVSSAANWKAVQHVWWAALPPTLYLIALILALVVLFGTAEQYSFMSVTQNSGTGRLDYYVLSRSQKRRTFFFFFFASMITKAHVGSRSQTRVLSRPGRRNVTVNRRPSAPTFSPPLPASRSTCRASRQSSYRSSATRRQPSLSRRRSSSPPRSPSTSRSGPSPTSPEPASCRNP